MMIELATVQDNPFRDFDLDPIDAEQVASLARSIGAPGAEIGATTGSGFWGGILVRPHGNDHQLVFGHHRLRALLQAGWTEADLTVVDFPDHMMAKVMVTENATQRKGVATVTEAVSAAVRVLGPVLLRGDLDWVRTNVQTQITQDAFNSMAGKFRKNGTIGPDLIRAFLGQDYTDRQIRMALEYLNRTGKGASYVLDLEAIPDALAEAAQAAKERADINPQVGALLGTNFNAARAVMSALTTDRAKRLVSLPRQPQVVAEVLGHMREEQGVAENADLVMAGQSHTNNLNKAVTKFIADGLRWLKTVHPEVEDITDAERAQKKFDKARTDLSNAIPRFLNHIEEGSYEGSLDIDLGPAFQEQIDQLISDLMTVRNATSKVVSFQ